MISSMSLIGKYKVENNDSLKVIQLSFREFFMLFEGNEISEKATWQLLCKIYSKLFAG